jgi:hypothetical protein
MGLLLPPAGEGSQTRTEMPVSYYPSQCVARQAAFTLT